jgi:hypothetical protein
VIGLENIYFELMRVGVRLIKASATQLVGALMSAAFLEIRTMSSTRDVLRSADLTNDKEVDFIDRVKMISEVCHQFPQVFLLEKRRVREKSALAAIEWRWMASSPEARAWILRVLDEAGLSIEAVVNLTELDERLAEMLESD